MSNAPVGYFYAASTQRSQRQIRAALQAAGLERCTIYVAVVFRSPAAVPADLWGDLAAKVGEPDFILDAPQLAGAPTFDLSQG